MKTSVIIPNWNGQNLLEDCLSSLRAQTYKNFEVMVVDNGSTDGSVQYIHSNFPGIKVIELDKNYGFAKAINEGVKKTLAEYVVFLNNDTAVDKNWLAELVKLIEKHPEVFSVNSKMLNFYDRKKIDGVGIEINEVGQAKSIGWDQTDIGQFAKEEYVFGATGGASLFRRNKFTKLGMFDESYFMYSEEVDLAFRAQFQGFKSIYCPKAIVYHKHKASSSKKPQHVEYWQFRNMYQTIIKNFPTAILLRRWRWLKILLVYFNTILYQLKNGYFWPPFAVTLWLIVHLPGLLIKRLEIQSGRRVEDEYIASFLKSKPITFWGIRD